MAFQKKFVYKRVICRNSLAKLADILSEAAYVIQGINSGGFLGSELYLVYLYVFTVTTGV